MPGLVMIGPVVWAVGEYIYIGYDLDLVKMVCTIPRWGTIIMPGLVMIGPVVWAVGEYIYIGYDLDLEKWCAPYLGGGPSSCQVWS